MAAITIYKVIIHISKTNRWDDKRFFFLLTRKRRQKTFLISRKLCLGTL